MFLDEGKASRHECASLGPADRLSESHVVERKVPFADKAMSGADWAHASSSQVLWTM
jgi:hypothetical protein